MITISRILSSYIIGDWSNEEDQKSKILYYISLSMTFAISQAILASLRCAIINHYSIQGTKKLHE
jgi:ATP-binding cassette subfamily C (CFTR/MRP) protein 1